MKHFDTHVRLAIGWKTFGINALTDFSCQPDKSVSKADKTSPRSPRSSAHHVPSYRSYTWSACPEICGDTRNMIISRPSLKYYNIYCQIKTLTLALSPWSGGREVRSCQPRRHSHKCGAEWEREGGWCFKFNSNPSQDQSGPARTKSDIFNYFIPVRVNTQQQSGPSCQVQWTETNAMIEFPQKTIQY